MLDKITIINPEGVEQEVYLITILTLEKYQSSYLVYSLNELTDGQNEIHFSKMNEEDDKMILENITNEEELRDLSDKFREELAK